nr:hypothetical protein [Tanacetum cinerariifolium]
MFLNMEQLEKQLDKEDFQEIGSIDAFNVLETQFQMFITLRVCLNDEYVAMTRNYFIQYTQQAILEFHDTLIQHLGSVKKSIDERAQHKREYDSWVNERQMQTTEEKVDMSKALDASSVDTESNRTESKEQDTSSSSGYDAHDDGADIIPIYDEEPMAKVQTTDEINVFAIGQQHTEQPEFNNEGKEREAASAKPHHMIASSNSRISSKNMPRFTSNDMVHNHYLEEAKKKTQEQHLRNSKNDSCVTKFLKEVNSRAKVPSNKTTNRNKPVEQISAAKKPDRQIPKGHRFSIKKTFVVHEKTMTHRSCLRWKPTGIIFKTVGLIWIHTGKIFASSTTKVDSEPLNGSNAYITNQYECEQTLDVSAGTFNLSAGTCFNPKEEGLRVWLLKDIYLINKGFKEFSTGEQVMTSDHNSLELGLHDHSNEQSSSKLVPDVVPPADKTATSPQELEFLFHNHITMLRSTL